MQNLFSEVEQGRKAELERSSAVGRFDGSMNEPKANKVKGIFITRRHWEKENRKRPIKSFNRIGKAELVEVGPVPDSDSTKSNNGPLVNGPYLKQDARRDFKENKITPMMLLVKPYITSVYPIIEKPKRHEKMTENPRGNQ